MDGKEARLIVACESGETKIDMTGPLAKKFKDYGGKMHNGHLLLTLLPDDGMTIPLGGEREAAPEQKWKKVYRTEHEVKMDDYVNGLFGVPCMDLTGKHIRVTIEEAVGECCEKWRGQWVNRGRVLESGAQVVWGERCLFCPECGKRL